MKVCIYYMSFLSIKSFWKKSFSQTMVGLYLWLLFSLAACNKFVEVDTPGNKITTQQLFNDDASATTAVAGLYSRISSSFLTIGSGGTTIYTGLSSDELISSVNTPDLKEFQTNSISSTNSTNQNAFWRPAYLSIYQANACIEGLTASNGMSPRIKNQLLGECKVVRSLFYFYLIQLYGDVPLITKTDYNTTSVQGRNSVNDIYGLIINDLTDAKNLLAENYPSDGRLRPNSYTAAALLARVYLFTGNWKLAETEANNIINSPKYILQSDLNKVFLSTSNEAIWQMASVVGGINTREGSTFLTTSPLVIPVYLISDQLLNAFEPGDPRKSAWIGSKTITNQTYYFPFKYKVPFSFSSVITEHYMVLRLAEQYLIRAEARIRQGKTDDGIGDLNVLRKRARGTNNAVLPDLPMGLPQDQALSSVLKERRIELMMEWGSRWFDLKRFHLCNTILKPIKPAWQDTDTLFPVPNQEILLNKNLTQNNGYN
ncbi:RagB/SusD family nutrient uptake outer membrane protein [Chitinophaga flava]|uniref:RagB/SusD family nutrient uptake outer membrane protein n=1 Tax=Chitinophaga flava TaxID=2259036 RepID=A0A365XXJ6_9BACT|nr:RagB/SusD family nutrient uptake outer membrane protein [Chitinophaga flava]RBL91109.1 RagB/SusD family nutrient uptake outer membrane protein [Chitinophaga flava]